MTSSFTVTSSVRGRCIELAAALSRDFAEASPAFRVLRQRDQPPESPLPGFTLFDTERQFVDLSAPACYARRHRGYTTGGQTDGGMWEFEIWEAHPNGAQIGQATTYPTAVHIDYWLSGQLHQVRLGGLTSAATSYQQFNNDVVMTVQYTKGNQVYQVKVQRTNGQPGGSFWWVDADDNWTPAIHFDTEEIWQATLDKHDLGAGQYEGTFAWTRGADVLLSGTVRHVVNSVVGGWELDVTLLDALPSGLGDPPGLDSEEYYYYSQYVDLAPGQNGAVYALPPAAPSATGSAVATPDRAGPDRFYAGLPAVHRNYDEPSQQEFGHGQLRRFLSPFGSAYDHARGLTEALALRHDPLRIHIHDLAVLARGLGWDVDRTTPGHIRRNDLVYAAEIFARVGTVDSLRALLLRALPAGWTFKIHEYTQNVFVLDGGANIRWDVWRASTDTVDTFTGAQFYANPKPDRVAGRPAAVFTPQNVEWMFWHDHSSGRREIWLRLPSYPGYGDRRVMQGTADSYTLTEYTDESPAALIDEGEIRLFWSSNRGGAWSIWTRRILFDINGMPIVPAHIAEQVSDDVGDDRSPAAVKEQGFKGRVWVFWASNRRGVSEIWARTRRWDADASAWVWDPAHRLTSSALGDHAPAAARDGTGKIHLFWSRVTSEGPRLLESTLTTNGDQDTWSAPVEVAHEQDPISGESPAVCHFQNKLRLYWHSDLAGKWQLWTSSLEPSGWSAPVKVQQSFADPIAAKHMVDAKEPAVAMPLSGAYIRTYWRAQQAGERFMSRTFDSADAGAKAALAQVDDWNHYTYDSGRTAASRVAHDTVGVHFTPPNDYNGDLDKDVTRIKAFVETYRPATVRIVWYQALTPIM